MELWAQSRLSCQSELTWTASDGETIRLMGIAFEMAVGSLGATPDHDDPIRKVLAQRIIALAQAGERDVECLCEGALRAVSSAGPSGWRGRPEGGQAAET